MKAFPDVRRWTVLLLAAAGGVFALVAISPLAGKGGALLLALLFWAAVVQGCIAAAAAGVMVDAGYVRSAGKELLSTAPLLLLMSFLLLLLFPFLDIYPWAGRQGGIWLRKDFFLGRNAALMLLAYLTARRFAAALEADGKEIASRAAAYLFVFVSSQTLAAFDLVMSLEYPWYSALFGGYFFIEALYAGFAVAALLMVLRQGIPSAGGDPEEAPPLKDISVLMFGFSLMWAGLFFAQYLTIWYGNIPEEASFVAKRALFSPWREISASILFFLFFLPFPALLSTRAKTNPFVVSAVALSILSGIFVERLVFVGPVALPGPLPLAIAFLALLAAFVLALRGWRLRMTPAP